MKKLFLLLLSTILISGVNSQNLRLDKLWWQPNGPINAIVKDTAKNIVYVGGAFRSIGPIEPFGAQIDTTTGQPDFAFANPNGTVNASEPDGNGGWYVGGEFTMVGDSVRNRIAHITSKGEVSSLFGAAGFDGSVASLKINDSIWSYVLDIVVLRRYYQ